jgi:hypothetical protein
MSPSLMGLIVVGMGIKSGLLDFVEFAAVSATLGCDWPDPSDFGSLSLSLASGSTSLLYLQVLIGDRHDLARAQLITLGENCI